DHRDLHSFPTRRSSDLYLGKIEATRTLSTILTRRRDRSRPDDAPLQQLRHCSTDKACAVHTIEQIGLAAVQGRILRRSAVITQQRNAGVRMPERKSGAPAMVKRSSTPFARLHRSACGEGATVPELELASQSSIGLWPALHRKAAARCGAAGTIPQPTWRMSL